MSSRSAEKIKIASFDDLFGEPVEVGVEQIINVKLSDLHTFKNHPFKVKEGLLDRELKVVMRLLQDTDVKGDVSLQD